MDFILLLRLVAPIITIIALIVCYRFVTTSSRRVEKVLEDIREYFGKIEIINEATKEILSEIEEDRVKFTSKLEEYVDNSDMHEKELQKTASEITTELEHRMFLSDEVKAVNRKVDGLGARWGMQTENAFREGMRKILIDVGYTVEKYRERDEEGVIYGHPGEEVEIDIIIRNGKTSLVEIKSRIERSEVSVFNKIANLYEQKENKIADSKILITPFIDDQAIALAEHFGIIVCTDSAALNP